MRLARWFACHDEWLLLAVLVWPVSLLGCGVLLLLGGALHSCCVGWRWDRHQQQLAGVVGAMLLAVTASHGSTDSWLGLFNYLPFVWLGISLSQVLTTQGRIRRVLSAVVASSWIVSALGLGQALLGWAGQWTVGSVVLYVKLTIDHAPRPTSIFTNPNSLAIYTVLVLAIALGLWVERGLFSSRIYTVLSGGAIVLGTPLLIVSTSRNGWLVALVGLLATLVIYRLWRWLAVLMGICVIPIGAALNVPGSRWIVPQVVWQRLIDSVDPSTQSYLSVVTRWQGWRLAAEMALQRPLTGWGWQSFARSWASQLPTPTQPLYHAHHLYLAIAAEGGGLVLMGLISLWGWMVWRGWLAWRWQCYRQGNRSATAILGLNLALLCYFCSGLLDAIYLDGRLNVLIWLLLAAANASWLCRVQAHQTLELGDRQSSS